MKETKLNTAQEQNIKFGNIQRDILLKLALDKEIERAKAAEQGMINNFAAYVHVELKDDIIPGAYEKRHILYVSLLNKAQEVISTGAVDLDTELIIKEVKLEKQGDNWYLVFYRQDGTCFKCSINELVVDYDAKIQAEAQARALVDGQLADRIDTEAADRNKGNILATYRNKIGGQTYNLPYYFDNQLDAEKATVTAHSISLDGIGSLRTDSIIVPSATHTTAGLESASDKLHLDDLYSQEADKGAVRLLGKELGSQEPYHFTYFYDIQPQQDKYVINIDTITLDNNKTLTRYTKEIPAASYTVAGLESAQDKKDLDAVRNLLRGDNSHTGTEQIRIPYYFDMTPEASDIKVTARGVSLDKDNNIVWEDTSTERNTVIVPAATASLAGLMSASDKVKLDETIPASIEAEASYRAAADTELENKKLDKTGEETYDTKDHDFSVMYHGGSEPKATEIAGIDVAHYYNGDQAVTIAAGTSDGKSAGFVVSANAEDGPTIMAQVGSDTALMLDSMNAGITTGEGNGVFIGKDEETNEAIAYMSVLGGSGETWHQAAVMLDVATSDNTDYANIKIDDQELKLTPTDATLAVTGTSSDSIVVKQQLDTKLNKTGEKIEDTGDHKFEIWYTTAGTDNSVRMQISHTADEQGFTLGAFDEVGKGASFGLGSSADNGASVEMAVGNGTLITCESIPEVGDIISIAASSTLGGKQAMTQYVSTEEAVGIGSIIGSQQFILTETDATLAIPGSGSNSIVVKNYVDAELANKMDKTGNVIQSASDVQIMIAAAEGDDIGAVINLQKDSSGAVAELSAVNGSNFTDFSMASNSAEIKVGSPAGSQVFTITATDATLAVAGTGSTSIVTRAITDDIASNLASEVSARTSADTALTQAIGTVATNLASEISARSSEVNRLDDRIDNLSAFGRFLSTWDCSTGKPDSEPVADPYTYKTGDYYIVGKVATGEAKNYRPDGVEYRHGQQSTKEESQSVQVNYFYLYDSTNWILLKSTEKAIGFASIVGKARDNTDLKVELEKVDAIYYQPSTEASATGLLVDEITARASDVSSVRTALSNHISDKENPHNVTKAQLSLENVDNTSDTAKPVSTAQASAIAAAASTAVAAAASYTDVSIASEVSARDTAIEAAVSNRVIMVTTGSRIYGTDASGSQTTYDKDSFGKVDDVKVKLNTSSSYQSVLENKVANIDMSTKLDKSKFIYDEEHSLLWIDIS